MVMHRLYLPAIAALALTLAILATVKVAMAGGGGGDAGHGVGLGLGGGADRGSVGLGLGGGARWHKTCSPIKIEDQPACGPDLIEIGTGKIKVSTLPTK